MEIAKSQKPIAISLYQETSVQKPDKLKSACIDFEAIFIGKMLEGLRNTVDKSGFIDAGAGEEIFQDMLFDEYAKSMAQKGTLGIAEMMYKDILSKSKLH